ncbi:hypothetical protein CSB45_05105 [candidate division KSB3 bacterium]|uniref:Glycosyltransferase RgtA/B/C/D-like domain-containing protein n=1 Tax=candidate division KSB3 bacterium TaxID=2044937 RepID=A0A2G6E8F7_9BACT|nr:MAG: hypothetical protein CSB45_05105 [candidate division KSB3 bacterium]PIE30433.1 MAG: hypothetical protein CSA57_03870 [candidate division KSB3 bacterium]
MTTVLHGCWKRYRAGIYPIVLLIVTLGLTGLGLSGGDFWWSDESRHAMDGVYIHDLLQDHPFFELYQYTERYYAKYPALALTWYPPFFALIEALFYSLFGISVLTARLTVIFFASTGMLFWYFFVQKIYGRATAFYSGVLYISTPMVMTWSHTVMLEIPTTAMIMISMYCFYSYFELDKKRYGFYLALSICGALYTKQTAGFILPVFLSYLLLRKQYKKLIQRESLLAGGLLCLFLIPLVVFTWKFGTVGVSLVLGDLKAAGFKSLLSQWTNYIRILPDNVLSLPVLMLAVVSIGVMVFKREERGKDLLFLLWIVWWYIYHSYLFGHTVVLTPYREYYGIYVVPPFCVLAVSAVLRITKAFKKQHHRTLKYLSTLLLPAVCLYQLMVSCRVDMLRYIDTVYDRAAEFVVNNPKGATVLISASYDGTFIFHLRKHDLEKKMIALRADKTLVSFSVFKKWGMSSYVDTEDDMYDLLRNYGTGYIVVEDQAIGEHRGIETLDMLKEMLRSGNFTLVKRLFSTHTIEPCCCCPKKKMHEISLSIYEYNTISEPQARELVIRFFHLGREIRIPFSKM